MSEDRKTPVEILIDGLQSRFKGDHTPATKEMIADVWAQFLLVHTMLMDVAKIHSDRSEPDDRWKAYQDLTKNLQKSILQISSALEELPLKTGENK